MSRRKIAIYVEGQTEHLLIYHLILAWWSYAGIQVKNIQLQANENQRSKVVDFLPEIDPETGLFFLIIDVQGAGSLASAIARSANKQHELGFDILGIRDLYPDHALDPSCPHKAPTQNITEKFQMALKKMGCLSPEKIDLFIAIMEIEAWLLAFPAAISAWAGISESDVLEKITDELKGSSIFNLEMIKRPSNLMKEIGKKRGDPKSFGNVMSITSSINCESIQNICKSNHVPSFNNFWKKLISKTSYTDSLNTFTCGKNI